MKKVVRAPKSFPAPVPDRVREARLRREAEDLAEGRVEADHAAREQQENIEEFMEGLRRGDPMLLFP
jgi:hypothetical protein